MVVLSKFQKCGLFTSFKENHTKPNRYKCHVLVTTEKSISVYIDGNNVNNKKEQKLIGVNLIRFYLLKVTSQVPVKSQAKNCIL